MLSKWVENTVGKGEIAHYEQFLLFLQCFQRLVLQTRKNQGLFGKGLTYIDCYITADSTVTVDTDKGMKTSVQVSGCEFGCKDYSNSPRFGRTLTEYINKTELLRRFEKTVRLKNDPLLHQGACVFCKGWRERERERDTHTHTHRVVGL